MTSSAGLTGWKPGLCSWIVQRAPRGQSVQQRRRLPPAGVAVDHDVRAGRLALDAQGSRARPSSTVTAGFRPLAPGRQQPRRPAPAPPPAIAAEVNQPIARDRRGRGRCWRSRGRRRPVRPGGHTHGGHSRGVSTARAAACSPPRSTPPACGCSPRAGATGNRSGWDMRRRLSEATGGRAGDLRQAGHASEMASPSAMARRSLARSAPNRPRSHSPTLRRVGRVKRRATTSSARAISSALLKRRWRSRSSARAPSSRGRRGTSGRSAAQGRRRSNVRLAEPRGVADLATPKAPAGQRLPQQRAHTEQVALGVGTFPTCSCSGAAWARPGGSWPPARREVDQPGGPVVGDQDVRGPQAPWASPAGSSRSAQPLRVVKVDRHCWMATSAISTGSPARPSWANTARQILAGQNSWATKPMSDRALRSPAVATTCGCCSSTVCAAGRPPVRAPLRRPPPPGNAAASARPSAADRRARPLRPRMIGCVGTAATSEPHRR